MNYFICALDKVKLGIPADKTERIIPLTRLQTNIIESENQETFISIPVLFRQKETAAPHGLVLKPVKAAGLPSKIILLAPRIDVDIEIPEENIHPLPEALDGLSAFLKGACFTGPDMILILDPEKLLESLP